MTLAALIAACRAVDSVKREHTCDDPSPTQLVAAGENTLRAQAQRLGISAEDLLATGMERLEPLLGILFMAGVRLNQPDERIVLQVCLSAWTDGIEIGDALTLGARA